MKRKASIWFLAAAAVLLLVVAVTPHHHHRSGICFAAQEANRTAAGGDSDAFSCPLHIRAVFPERTVQMPSWDFVAVLLPAAPTVPKNDAIVSERPYRRFEERVVPGLCTHDNSLRAPPVV